MRQRLLLLSLAGGLAGTFAFPAAVHAQATARYTFQGTVTDAAGEPLIGANVQLVGQRVGATTDVDGRYRFEAAVSPGRYTVQFTYVGYATETREVTLGAAPSVTGLDVTLAEDAVGLDEVIVTGSGAEVTRRQLGNNISVVTAAAVENMGTSNPLGAFAGRVAGAQVTQNSGDPAGGFSVQLRGTSSIGGSSDPLYIVDGVIVDNSSQNVINLQGDSQLTGGSFGQNRLVDLNPNDIERIEVLNGAAASAIYGSRAANGVVQIFTKRGQSGAPRVEYSVGFSGHTLRQAPALSTYGRRFGIQGNADLTTAQDRLTTLLTNGLTTAQQTALVTSGQAVRVPGRVLVTDQYNVTRYNYWDDIFAPAGGVETNLSVSGGRDQTRFFASLGAVNNGGIVRNTAFQKYTGRLRVDQQIASWLDASVGVAYSQSRSNDLPVGTNFFSPISTVFIIDNVWALKNPDGTLRQVEQVRVNPLSVVETFDISQLTNRTTANLTLTATPAAGLTLTGIAGVDQYALTGDEYRPAITYPSVDASFFPDGYVSNATSNVRLFNTDLTATYVRALTPTLRSTTTAGGSYQYNRSSFSSIQGRGLAPFVRTVRAITNPFVTPVETRSELAVYGGFLQQTFGLRDEFFLTLAGRVDGSSAFAESERTQFYPKASLSWVASERWKGDRASALFQYVPTFKLRASYGEAGNMTGIGAYDRFDNYGLTSFTGGFALQPSRTLGNPNVSPERMREVEGGVEAGLFGGRAALVLNVYQQKVTNVAFQVPLPPTAGGTAITTNIGDEDTYLRNRGIELQLNGTAYRRSGVTVDLGLTYNRNSNVVMGAPNNFSLRSAVDGPQFLVNGEPFGVFYGRYYARNDDGSFLTTIPGTVTVGGVTQAVQGGLRQPARGFFAPVAADTRARRAALGYRLVNPANEALCDALPVGDESICETVDANGQPVGVELRKVLGSPDPDWTGGLTMNVQAGRFAFGTLIEAVMGNEVYNWNRVTANNVGHGDVAEAELRGEVPRGTVASIAGGVTGSRIQEEHIEDGSYVKLREVSLTYNVGRIWRAQALAVTLSGRNLLSFDDYRGFDPETNAAGQSNRVRGDDFGNVPIPRTVSLRFNVRF